ncbi:unnamed protein product [Heterobilharzia americana]|nr:unnamed protein product [Heterobilharzia americana]
MEKNHEEVLGANHQLYRLQKELVNWCDEIDKRLYDMDNQYKVIFAKNREDIFQSNNNPRIFSASQPRSQLESKDINLPSNVSCNEYPSHGLQKPYICDLSDDNNKKRPHSSDGHLLRRGRNTCTENKIKAISTNSLVVQMSHCGSPLHVNNSECDNLANNLLRISMHSATYKSKHQPMYEILPRIANPNSSNFVPIYDQITSGEFNVKSTDNKIKNTFIDWEKLSLNLARIRRGSCSKIHELHKNFSRKG